MEVFPDLLPPSFTAKTEPSSKDSQRPKQQAKNQSKTTESTTDSELAQDNVEATDTAVYQIERRVGGDRRHQQTNRGRWLESRARNDRRASDSEIFVKV